MSMTLSQQHAYNPNALVLQIDPPAQNEPSTPAASRPPSSPAAVQPPPVNTLARLNADREVVREVADKLHAMTATTGRSQSAVFIRAMATSTVAISSASSYYSAETNPERLSNLIGKLGFAVPRTVQACIDLAKELDQKAAVQPLGDFGGARSWPIPMSKTDEGRLANFLFSETTGVPGLPLPRDGKRTLGYLLSGSSVTPSDLQDPPKALEKLLTSPKALALGQALQTYLNGAPSETSIYDYLLSAIHIGLDPSSVALQERNKVDEVDLMQPSFWGRTASTVIANLTRNLIAKGRVTADTAKLGVYLLLAKQAPHLLIKDIPGNITVGSHAWAFLSIAAARIEAERPGTVANMSFVDVMSYPEPTGGRSLATQQAEAKAIIDWGIANGVITKDATDTYTPEQINSVRTQFNQQLNERLDASTELDRELPSLKQIAISELNQRFDGPEDLYEAQVLGTDQYRGSASQTGLVGEHSMLDIAMMGLPNLRPLVSSNPRIPVEALNKNLHFDAPEAFNQQFSMAIKRKKAAVNTTVRHLISQLPAEDRRQFEFGKITLFREGSYTLDDGLFNTTENKNKPGLMVKTELEGHTKAYVIDISKATIESIPKHWARHRDERNANVVSTTREFKTEDAPSGLGRERPANNSLPSTFNSQRSREIGDEYVKHIDLDKPAVKKQARGQTTLDKLKGGPNFLDDMLLNLIPFRSAFENFKKGKYLEGTFDLVTDIFGFVVAGASAAGRLIKIGAAALSAGIKLLKTAKVIGAATIGALNPLDGLGSLVYGGANLLRKAGSKLYNVANLLKGASGSYDLLKAASKSNGIAATGTYKLADQSVETGAILKDKKWYSYDAINQRPYGPPLTDFKPGIIAADSKTLVKFDEPTQKWHLYDPVKQQIAGKPLENFNLDNGYSLGTLMNVSSPKAHSSRYNPLSQAGRSNPPTNRVPLPLGEYATDAESTGKLILDHFTPSRINYTRQKFTLEMNGFYSDVAAGKVPPRPQLPTITANMTPDELIAEALKKTDVLVFGELHEEVASLVLLRDSMKTLKDNGVTTIYLEGMSLGLAGKIDDTGLAHNISKRAGGQTLYADLKKAADDNDIDIMPLEHKYLTLHRDSPGYFDQLHTLPKTSPQYNPLAKQRLEEMNYYGARQVTNFETDGKSVVWVGRSHMKTSLGVPGIAELTGGIGIGVYQKPGITQSLVRKDVSARDPSLPLSSTDTNVGDLQIDVKI